MFYPLPKDFYQTLTDKYEKAVESGSVLFNGSDSESSIVHESVGNSKIDFQVTLLHSLMHRPEKGTKEENPFAKPEPELTIVDQYGPENEFKVVFNKFPVVPKHFMVVTKEFKSQNTPLSASELLASYSLLHELKSLDSDLEWFAFYNSGPESGASQPHKHIQFMTLPKGFTPYPETLANASAPFIPSAKNEPLQNGDLPFAHFVARLPDNASDLVEDDMTIYFASLLQRALTVSRQNEVNHISYNFIMTTKYMMIVPRSSGKYKDLGINSCGVVGLFLCKNNEMLKIVKEDTPITILKEVGFPSTAGEKGDEYDY